MKLPETQVVAKVRCRCSRENAAVSVRIRYKFKGNQGKHAEPCWNCRREIRLIVHGLGNIWGEVETYPGTDDFSRSDSTEVESKDQKF